MAHTCPECGETCYCNGDIDDCLNDFYEDVNNCTHIETCNKDEIDMANETYDYEDGIVDQKE